MTDAAGNDPEELARALSEFTDPMQAYSNSQEGRAGAGDSLTEFADQLQVQIEAQDRWVADLRRIAFRGREDVARKLATAGPGGAALAAALSAARDGDFNRAADSVVERLDLRKQGATQR